ncbi:Lanosterol 14-alpha demethylase [Cytospora mali]|uniref:Lanosterol 14-alpha demethylase n=1 Tax=Cytospora mali TaxID=578113 RepID=A0A194WBP8_CYTMA|nr:Lanosterol 14-alpha demethylase [Valsa mali]
MNIPFHEAYGNIFEPETLGKLPMVLGGFIPVRWIPCEANRKFLFAASWLNDTVHKLVRQRRSEIEKAVKAESSSGMLSTILKESTLMEGGMADMNNIVGHLLILLSGGHGTSAMTMSWGLYELVRRPDVQEKLRQEMKIFEENCPDPTCTELDALPYLNNLVKDILRILPPGQ